ncbi:odorant receptor 49b-like [Uranotaenia lowii]|uniref:odorant receptor 49b-like n=1 Tax=Uranotaenia lowii TaxID=190385 RepID=UPI00247840CD|nr:odorant receptor 49b-like [Uranotaenia lowii]
MVAYINATADSFAWCILTHIRGLFRIARWKIKHLDQTTKSEQFQRDVCRISNIQEVAYRSTQLLESVLSNYFFKLYGLCICILCMIMMIAVTASENSVLLMKMFLILCYIIWQIFAYSMLGTELHTESTQVADELFESQWYVRPVADQQLIRFMIMRAQRAAYITAGKFFYVTRITFMVSLRTAFSYFTVMRQVI